MDPQTSGLRRVQTPKLIPVRKLERGIAYAESCFETFRVIDGQVFALERHAERLRQAAALFGWSIDAWEPCQRAVRQLGGCGDHVLRLTLTAGAQPWGMLPSANMELRIYAQSHPTPSRAPLRLRLLNARALPPRAKHCKLGSDYADFLRLYHRHRHHLHAEEMPLWHIEGRLISTMSANILLYADERWWTPNDARALPGIVRQHLLDAGVLHLAPCTVEMARHCQAMACSNSGVFLQPVLSIDGRRLDIHPRILAPLREALRQQPGVVL